jgi:putative peptidoglycan lipid II flippase
MDERDDSVNAEPEPGAVPPGDLTGVSAAAAGAERERERGRLIRSAGTVGGMTVVSRVLGLAREMLYASIFGAGAVNDAFRIAYAIPYFFRRVLGENAMASYFLPLFIDYKENKGPQQAWRLADNVFNALLVVTAVLAGLFALFAPQILRVIAPGFTETGNLRLAIGLTREMVPFMVTMSLAAVLMSLLNAHRRFALPSSGPIILNLVFIAGLYTLVPLFGESKPEMIHGVAVAVVVGGVLQVVVLGAGTRGLGWRWKPRLDFRHPGLRKVMKLMVPALFGLAVTRINLLVDNALASLLGEGTISALNYSERLLQFPLGVFGIAMATAVLPALSSYAAKRDWGPLRDTFNDAVRLALFVAVPATVGLVVLREPLIALFFQRGAFTAAATTEAAWALLFYALGLTAYIGVHVTVPVFYAQKDTKTPVIAAAVAVVVNIGGDLALMWSMEQGGLALASAAAAFVNWGILLVILRRRMGPLGLRSILNSGLRILGAAAAMGAGLFFYLRWIAFDPATALLGQKLLGGAGGVLLGAGIYFGAARLLGVRELGEIARLIPRRGTRRR